MVESEKLQPAVQLSGQTTCQDAVVFASGSCDDEVQQRVSRVLERLQAQTLINRVTFCDVTKADAMDSVPDNATLLILLIDDEHLNGASASHAAYLATRKSVTGRALVIALLTQASTAFASSPLSFLSPVPAHSNHLASALVTFEKRVREFCTVSDVASREAIAPDSNAVAASSNTEPPSHYSDLLFNARLQGASQIAETVEPLPCHMSVYDDFIEHLIGRLQVMRMHDRRRNLNLFSEALRTVLNAEMVYCYYRSKNGALHIYEAESNKEVHECSAAVVHSVLEDALKGYSHDLSKCSLKMQNFLPQLVSGQSSNIECMVVVNEKLPNCGVFVAAKGGFSRFPLTEVISTVINTLHDQLAWAKFETFEKLKARVYDELRGNYRFVSKDMYEDRLRIFKNQLSNLKVHFEPMFRFDRKTETVEVFAYEALAREHENSQVAPVEIFITASAWGMGFQSELDSALLRISLASYEMQIAELSQGSEVKPLSLNIYPATLRSMSYRELLCDLLGESDVLFGHNLIMEVSEKTVVSPEHQMEVRQQLDDYRGVVDQLTKLTGVRFAIDDFGVGNSSLSRLDRLKPHYVKIDRDILSFDTRMASTLIRYLIDSQGQQGASVILEGVDIHSKLSLDELVNDIGVDIIQGHCLSKAVSGFDPVWEQQTCERVKRDLGWNTPVSGSGGELILH